MRIRRDLLRRVVRATLEDGGATVDLTRGTMMEPRDRWYFPRHPELTRIVPVQCLAATIGGFVSEHARLWTRRGLLLGTWVNPDSGDCYVDLITHESSRARALDAARRHGRDGRRAIVALCNPHRRLTVDVRTGQLRRS